MTRAVTLFTGQWADLPLETVAKKAKVFGFDGLELACWGDHFDVQRALKEDGYAQGRRDLLAKHGLQVFAISNHLVGQAVCDNIDARHKSIIPPHVWGDGNPQGVQQRAAKEMQDTARAAAKLGVKTVAGFTGSSIWPLLYSFPPVPDAMIDAGFDDFATRHFGYQGVDYVAFIDRFADRIYHVHMKDVWWSDVPRPSGVFGGHLNFGHPDRFWEFRSIGRGKIKFEEIIRHLNAARYDGPLSIEWEDIGMDREAGAKEACAFVKAVDFRPPHAAFDSAFARE